MAAIDQFLTAMLNNRGTDLHLNVGLPPTLRVDQQMASFNVSAIDEQQIIDVLREICPPNSWDTFRVERDLDFVYMLKNSVRFRCHYFYDHNGLGAVFHRIQYEVKSLRELNLPGVLESVCQFSDGLILVSGPSGSGKSRTLAAMIDYINTNFRKFVITIESPIEFVHANKQSIIVQREIGRHCESFVSAIKNTMRAGPDVVVIGDEINDAETIKQALTCAAMGILVICTMHTNNASKTLNRLISTFPQNEHSQIQTLLAKSLVAVVTQILCDGADGQSKVPALETIQRSEILADTIRSGDFQNLRALFGDDEVDGMRSMDTSLRELLAQNRISPMEAYMKAIDKQEFAEYLPEQTYWSATHVKAKEPTTPKFENCWVP